MGDSPPTPRPVISIYTSHNAKIIINIKLIMISDVKLVLTGNKLHHYKYSKPQLYGEAPPKTIKRPRTFDEQSIENSESNNYRTKTHLKRIIDCNARQYLSKELIVHKEIFVTLTFKDDVNSLAEANPIFTRFIKRLNYQIFKQKKNSLKYLVVPEFQKLTRQAVHYHVIFFNLPFIPQVYDFFNQVWAQGNVNVRTIKTINGITKYVVKYITKQTPDERLFNKKKYFTSRGLKKPILLRNQSLVNLIDSQVKIPHVYKKEFNKSYLTTIYKCTILTEKLKSLVKSIMSFFLDLPSVDLSKYYPPIQLELTLLSNST